MKNFYEMLKLVEIENLGSDKPVPLSQINPQMASVAISAGQKDQNDKDDKSTMGKLDDTVSVGELKPMQKEVIPMKALGMALQYLLGRFNKLTDMEAIVSQDNYIMDGHHRWAAATLIDPGMSVKVARVGLPAAQLITALNLYTKSKGRAGNSGAGDITQFASSIPSLVDKVMNEGIPDQTDKNTGKVIKGLSVEEAKQAFAKLGNGDAVAGGNTMKANASRLPTQKHPNAPERVDMPVIEGKAEIKEVVDKLMAGDIDWNKPLSKETQTAMGMSQQQVGGGVQQGSQQNIGASGQGNQQNVGANVAGQQQNVDAAGGASFQQNVGAAGQSNQQNVSGYTPGGATGATPQVAGKPNPAQQKSKTQPSAPGTYSITAHSSHEGPNLNEWLVLAGVKDR